VLFSKLAVTLREEETGDREKLPQARCVLEFSVHATMDNHTEIVRFYKPRFVMRSILQGRTAFFYGTRTNLP